MLFWFKHCSHINATAKLQQKIDICKKKMKKSAVDPKNLCGARLFCAFQKMRKATPPHSPVVFFVEYHPFKRLTGLLQIALEPLTVWEEKVPFARVDIVLLGPVSRFLVVVPNGREHCHAPYAIRSFVAQVDGLSRTVTQSRYRARRHAERAVHHIYQVAQRILHLMLVNQSRIPEHTQPQRAVMITWPPGFGPPSAIRHYQQSRLATPRGYQRFQRITRVRHLFPRTLISAYTGQQQQHRQLTVTLLVVTLRHVDVHEPIEPLRVAVPLGVQNLRRRVCRLVCCYA